MNKIIDNITTILVTLIISGLAYFGSTKLDLWLKQRAVTSCLESSYTMITITEGGYTTNTKQINQQAYNFCMQAKGYK